jgi:hypothetical protein
MKLARLIVVPSLGLGFGMGCSDPPSLPAQGAATMEVSPLAGGGCNTSRPITVPVDSLPHLTCNTALGDTCEPAKEVVVDRDDGNQVECSVVKSGESYTISFSLQNSLLTLSGNSAQGAISASGGPVAIYSYNSGSGVAQQSEQCTLMVNAISAGSIWASFECPTYGEPSSPSGPRCSAAGIFVFEHCSD